MDFLDLLIFEIYNFHNLNLRDKSLKENNLLVKEKDEF